MRPFQEFRYWTRRAPGSERAVTGVAALIVLVLLAWLLVPEGDDNAGEQLSTVGAAATDGGTTAGGEGADPIASEGGGDAAPATAVDGGTAATSGGTTPAAGGGTGNAASTAGAGDPGACVSPPGKAKGISDKEVKVVVVLTAIGIGGANANTLFDVPSPAQAKADFEAAISGINKEGGVACRKLVAQYVEVNPTDEQGMIQRCREFASLDIFAVVDTGSMATRPAVLACLGQNKTPYFGAFYITDSLRRQFFPYLYSFYYKEQVYKDTAFALKELGFYDPAKGFGKLGFIHRDCEKDAINAFRGWIRDAGVPDDKVVAYNLGCPQIFASESDMAQAAVTFRREGVTHVIGANVQGDISRITANFEQQGFRPKWAVPDEALLSIATGSRAPNPQNFANAIAVTLARDGEQDTPGLTPTAGTQRCNAYRKAAGLPPVWDVPANAGHACDQLWMLDGALSNAPELSPAGLQVGLQRTKSIDYSFPQGVNDFTPQGTTTGGQFFRVAQFTPACTCWRVIQKDFRKGF